MIYHNSITLTVAFRVCALYLFTFEIDLAALVESHNTRFRLTAMNRTVVRNKTKIGKF